MSLLIPGAIYMQLRQSHVRRTKTRLRGFHSPPLKSTAPLPKCLFFQVPLRSGEWWGYDRRNCRGVVHCTAKLLLACCQRMTETF